MKTHKTKPDIPEAIPNLHIRWEKSKEQVWAEMEERLELAPDTPVRMFQPRRMVAMAAALIILVGLTLFMNLFTRTTTVERGNHDMAVLPDGSTVRLNAESQISYKPLMWFASKTVKLKGEAFFEGEHSRNFKVVSDAGITTVIGTSFNIYARNSSYEVTCITGKVKVSGTTSPKEVLLTTGQKVTLAGAGEPRVNETVNADQVLSWMSHRISVTSAPLSHVFEEIERQYGVTVVIPKGLDYIYTGNFDCSIPVENALQTVCKPFNLTFVLNSDAYVISKGP